MKPAPMPHSVVVGPHSYTIVRKARKGYGGWCDFNTLQVFVHPRMRRSKAQEVLLHEILHACTYPTLNKDDIRGDEEFVEGVTPILLQALQCNPGLVAYLTT